MSAARSRNGAFSGTLLVAVAASGWGTWTLFLRDSGLSPAWQSVMILLVIAGASLPSALRAGRGRLRPRKIWLLVGLSGAFDAANYGFFFTAVDRGPIAVAVLTHYLAPVMVALLAPRLLREPLGKRTPPALLCSLCGLALLLAGSAGIAVEALPAALAGGASAIFYGANTLLSKRLLDDVSSAELLSYHSLVAALLLLPLAGPPPPLRLFLFRPLAGALLVGWVGGWLFLLGLRLIPAQRGAVLTYLEPLVASAVGAAVFDEAPGPLGLLGGVLILAGGVAVALQPAPARDAASAPET